ncbi:MAG TPA: hypothetical protein VK604_10280 [Bryobacteraceae bacterium]|nr:hypothetical protein [Bryobacteraceae bacterium]
MFTKAHACYGQEAETPTSYIAMGFDEDLKTATGMAVRNMIDFLVAEKHLSGDDAYTLTSVAIDLNITQLVDSKVGVHATCPEGIFDTVNSTASAGGASPGGR